MNKLELFINPIIIRKCIVFVCIMAKAPKSLEMPNEYFVNCTFEIYVTQKKYSSISKKI